MKKRNEPKLSSRTDTVLAQPAPLIWGAGKPESRKYKTNPFWTNEPILKNNHYAVTSDMEIAYDQQTSIGYPKNEPKIERFIPTEGGSEIRHSLTYGGQTHLCSTACGLAVALGCDLIYAKQSQFCF